MLNGLEEMSAAQQASTISTSAFVIFDTGLTRYVASLGASTTYERSYIPGIWCEPCSESWWKRAMFKISTIDTERERRLVVEGTLVQPWVAEFQRTWSEAGNSLEGRTLVIDLTNATVISREGESAIFELMKQGAKFSCCGVLTRHLLKQLAHRCHTRLTNVLNCEREELKRDP
jgi:hypothetical protein